MKKDLLKTFVFAAVVSIVFIFVLFELDKFKKEEETKEISKKIIRLDLEKLTSLKYKNMLFVKEGNTWWSTSPYKDLLNTQKVEDWVNKAFSFEGHALSSPGEAIEWGDFEIFEEEEEALKFTTNSGNYAKVFLSKRQAFDESVYLKRSDSLNGDKEDILYRSTPEWKSFLSVVFENFRAKEVLDWDTYFPGSEVSSVEFFKKGTRSYKIYKKDGQWKTNSSNRQKWTLDKAKVESYLDDFKKVPFKTSKAFESLKDLSNLGRVKVSLTQGGSLEGSLYVDKSKRLFLRTLKRENLLFRLDKNLDEFYFPDLWDFRSFEDAVALDSEKVVRLDVTKGDDVTIFRKNKGAWTTAASNLPKGKKLNGAKILELMESFKSLDHIEYVSRSVPLGDVKKKLYFRYEGGKYLIYYVGDRTHCSESKKWLKNCYIVRARGLQLKIKRKELDKVFKTNFYMKKEEPLKAQSATDEKPLKSKNEVKKEL